MSSPTPRKLPPSVRRERLARRARFVIGAITLGAMAYHLLRMFR